MKKNEQKPPQYSGHICNPRCARWWTASGPLALWRKFSFDRGRSTWLIHMTRPKDAPANPPGSVYAESLQNPQASGLVTLDVLPVSIQDSIKEANRV